MISRGNCTKAKWIWFIKKANLIYRGQVISARIPIKTTTKFFYWRGKLVPNSFHFSSEKFYKSTPRIRPKLKPKTKVINTYL